MAGGVTDFAIGGVWGSVQVKKTMRIAGDLTVGRNLTVMGKVYVAGEVDLSGKEWEQVVGEEPVRGDPAGNSYG